MSALIEKVRVGKGLKETISIISEIEQRAWVIFRKDYPLVYRHYTFGGINEGHVFFYYDSPLGQTIYKVFLLEDILCS